MVSFTAACPGFILYIVTTFFFLTKFINILFVFRWSQLRMALLPHLILLEPFSECMLVGLTASWAIEYLFGISSMGIFLMHILVWFLLDYSMLRLVEVRVTLKTSFVMF